MVLSMPESNVTEAHLVRIVFVSRDSKAPPPFLLPVKRFAETENLTRENSATPEQDVRTVYVEQAFPLPEGLLALHYAETALSMPESSVMEERNVLPARATPDLVLPFLFL